jgi:hypothetical protein
MTASWNRTEGGSEKCISSPSGRLTALSNELTPSEGLHETAKKMLIDPANVSGIGGCVSTGTYLIGPCLLIILCSGVVRCFLGGGGGGGGRLN